MKKRIISTVLDRLAFDNQKMVFLSGPRQVGKTTLAKDLLEFRKCGTYTNWDEKDFRKAWTISPKSWIETIVNQNKSKPLIVIDELHKARLWKRDLKGIYDHFKNDVDFMVTGSARLDVFKKGSDSLLGRFFAFTLHPFSYSESLGLTPSDPNEFLKKISTPSKAEKKDNILNDLLEYGGFPEPYLKKNKAFHRLWQKNRHEKIVREDLRDISRLLELSQIEMLMSLLPDRTSNLLSVQSLREDLEVSHGTVTRWLNYLEQLYYCYLIRPYSKGIARSLKKEPKMYLWDWSELTDEGAKFENLIASHLIKTCSYWNEIGLGKFGVNYLRNKQKEEVDFLISNNGKPYLAIEVKLNDTNLSPSLIKFSKQLKLSTAIQVIRSPGYFKVHLVDEQKIIVMSAEHLLTYCG